MEVDERKLSRIPLAELERRWKLVRAYLKERGIDALIAQSAKDFTGGYVKWLTDVPAAYPRTVIFHADDLMSVIEHGPEAKRRELNGNDRDHPGVGEIFSTAAFPSVAITQSYDAEVVCRIVAQRNYKRICFVGAVAAPHGFIAHIENALQGQVTISDETDFVDRVKAIKSATEIELIRETAKMQDQVFQRLLLKIKPGMQDSEISAIAQFEGQLLGSEQGIFLGCSARIGRSSFFAQRHFQGRTFRKGDYFPVLIENNGVGGYYCELARTIVWGKSTQELIEANATMREAQEHTVKKLRPGASCKEIFLAHNEFMGQKGLPLETRLYSHSQGYDLVERPIVRSDETLALDEGMNMAVHPAFATGSIFSVICDNYLIERDGPSECLHGTPKEIFELN